MHKLVVAAAACAALAAPTATPAIAEYNPFVGETATFAFNFCPLGWLPMDGQAVAIADYEPLFNLLGTTYGGNGTSNFGIPTAKPVYTATGVKLIRCISTTGIYPTQN